LATAVAHSPGDAIAGVALMVGIFATFVMVVMYKSWRQLRRAEFIRTYRWPRGLLKRLEQHHPGLTRKESALISRRLRQFFIAYLESGRSYVSMPSQIVDDLWHEFILYTREYDRFCRRAFGGFLHHTPAVVLDAQHTHGNAGLRRVWWYTCRYENIDPAKPSRLPLLFALDAKLNVENGFVYHADCEFLRDAGVTGVVHCGADFSSRSIDGSSAGYGARSSSHTGSSCGGGCAGGGGCGGGGDGGGCGGGCGGGGD